MSTQETRECLLCLRIPLERVRETAEALLHHVDNRALVDGVAERAAKLIAAAYEKDRIALCGKKPSGIMAAAIYLSGIIEKGVEITQDTIARALNITIPTLSLRAHEINDLLGLGIMEQRVHQGRKGRKLYVCPFCEKTFPNLTRLILHLLDGGWKNAPMLRVRMFNVDGILVDVNVLEEIKRRYGTCERPLAVRPRPRGMDWRESPVVGRYIVTG